MVNFIIMFLIILLNIFTVYKLFFKMLFKDFNDFNESIRFLFTPDIFSLFRRQYIRDRTAEFRLSILLILCISITLIEYEIIVYLAIGLRTVIGDLFLLNR